MRNHFFGGALTGLAAALMPLGALAQEPPHAASLESLAARLPILEDREAIRAPILAYGAAHGGRPGRGMTSRYTRVAG